MENEVKGFSLYMPRSLCIFICALKNINPLILTSLMKLMNLEMNLGKFSQKESRNAVPGSKENVARYKKLQEKYILLCKFLHDSLMDDSGVVHLVNPSENTSLYDHVFAVL